MVFSYVAQHPLSAWGAQKQAGGGAAGRRGQGTPGHNLLPAHTRSQAPLLSSVLKTSL